MAPVKRLAGRLPSREKLVEKKKMLGAFLVLSFVAFGATVVTYLLFRAKVDVLKAAILSLIVGGLFAVLIEMRGTMGKRLPRKLPRIRKLKLRSKTEIEIAETGTGEITTSKTIRKSRTKRRRR